MMTFPSTTRTAAAVISLLSGLLVASGLHVPTARAYTGDFYIDVAAEGVKLHQGQCRSANVYTDGEWSDYDSSTVEITIRGPRGGLVRSEVIENDADGWIDRWYRICYRKPAGRYSVDVTVSAYDEYGTEYNSTDQTGFWVTKVKPKKRSRIAERHGRASGGGKRYPYAAIGTLWRAGKRYAGAKVYLQAKLGGYWYDIDSARTRSVGAARGKVGWYFKPNPYRWRFKFYGDDRTKSSASDGFGFPRSARMQRTPGDLQQDDLAGLVTPTG